MTLLDHFRPPFKGQRHWHSFLQYWAGGLAADLNARLPARFFAEPNVQHRIEIDVATCDAGPDGGPTPTDWAPPPAGRTIPLAVTEDVVHIHVFEDSGGPILAAAIELVSPSNKDRQSHRDAFVSKCATYLHAGVGLVIVDVVTERTADLHGELLTRLGAAADGDPTLFASAYRPTARDGATVLDVWREPLAVGGRLPTVPLWLRDGPCLPVDLQAAYDRTCRDLKVPSAA